MDSKAKWQLDFEVELSLLNNEDLLSRYINFGNRPFDFKKPLTRAYKKRSLIQGEILYRMACWTLNRGSFDPMGN